MLQNNTSKYNRINFTLLFCHQPKTLRVQWRRRGGAHLGDGIFDEDFAC